jgi:hypothetical protein
MAIAAIPVLLMKLIPVVVSLLAIAAPAAAQSRLYTNADLVTGPVTWTRTVTPEELQGLIARQFVYVPRQPSGPFVGVVGSSPTAGPFGEFRPFPVPTRLDGTSYPDPPWQMTTHIGRSYAGPRSRPRADARRR